MAKIKACPRGTRRVKGRCVGTAPKFKSGDKAYLNDVVDGYGKIEVRLGGSSFVSHPEYWGYRGKPQNFYSFRIVDPDYRDIELSYSHVPESRLSRKP